MIDLQNYILLYGCTLSMRNVWAFRTKIQTQSINSESSLIDVEPKKRASISQSKNVFSVIHCNGHHSQNSHPTNILVETFYGFSALQRNDHVIFS